MAGRHRVQIVLGVALLGAVAAAPALAQKNSGPLLPPPSAGYAPPAAGTGLSQDPTVPAAPVPRTVRPPVPASASPRPPQPPQYVTPQYVTPQYVTPQYGPGQGGANPDATRLAATLPLDPQTRDLRDRAPTDPREIERRLGLREPTGPVTDLRGRTPSVREIIDALRPR